jgi:serine phosphatase RsbU (regulator of sigma subunit)
MAVSFVAATLAILLMLELLASTVVYNVLMYSPVLGYLAMTRAGHAAKIFALQAAVDADWTVLDPDTTFRPGQPASLSLQQEGDPPEISYLELDVPYIAPGSPAPPRPTFALLVDSDGWVVASSYPGRYPVSANIDDLLPEGRVLIQSALAGTSEGAVREGPLGRVAAVARPVIGPEQSPLGAVYIETPGGWPAGDGSNLLAMITWIVLPSSLFWLCLILPIGALFGVLTTRNVIRRIERLAGATARFTQGEYTQRVPVSRPDEIGQLEQQFNRMAEQLVDSFEQRRALAEQSARREERARIDQELTSAYYIQRSLLPEEVPSLPGWEIEPFYRPARQVGGDLYDFLALPGGQIGIVIGDANGKGMPAALIMATTCTMVRAAAPGLSSPGEVLARVNNLLQDHVPPATFATCFYAILDPPSGRIRFANAGHTLPYLCRDREILELRATGMPLGLMRDQSYPENEIASAAGDCLLFHTDGLAEARDPGRQLFGLPRLRRLLQEHDRKAGLVETLLRELDAFTGPDWEQEDDITLIVLRRAENSSLTD